MKTSELISLLNSNDTSLSFLLPSGEEIGGDLHITEVKNVHVNSTDCGGNAHQFEETIIQLWKNERSLKKAKWSTSKAKKIMDTVARTQPFLNDTEVFFEYGDSSLQTGKFGVQAGISSEGVTLYLQGVATQCKPSKLSKVGCC